MPEEFKKGDVVQLKSGSPRMTVTDAGNAYLGGEAYVSCVWFDDKHKREEATFPPEALEKV